MSDSEGGEDASLFGESNAPDAVPQQQMNASQHDQQAGNWAGRGRAGGRGGTGRGRGRGAGAGGAGNAGNAGNAGGAGNTGGSGGSGGGGAGAGVDGAHPSTALVLGDDGSGDGPTFTGISLKDLEFRLRNNKDGAESSLCTDDESVTSRKRRRAPTGGAPASRGKAVSRRKSTSGRVEDELGAAVFGSHDEDFEEDFEGDEDEDEDDLGASESASQAEGGGSAPIRGERCPGCILDRDTVGQVEKFVRENAMMMSETPLFKAAALFYEQKVLAAHRREGVRCCKWPWKSIREHFSLHVVDPVLARISVIRTLGNIRSFSESNLVRVEGDGSKQLDPKQIELLLKVSAVSATRNAFLCCFLKYNVY